MTSAMCRQVQEAIARDGASPELIAARSRHLRDCADCRALEHARSRVRDGILAGRDELDDLTRARVLARLLESRPLESATGRSARGPRVWLGWTLAFSAVLVLLVTGVLHFRKAGEAGAPAPFPAVALEPYAVHGNAGPGSPAPSSGGLDRVELPPHASMRARLGRAADFVLLGPLELAVREGDERRAQVELRRGTLVGDFDGSMGGHLRIVTVDATVDVVGTRFLVEASTERTRVSVDHGRVRVESHGQVRFVGAQQEWTTDRSDVESLDAARAALFQRASHGKLEELAPEAAPAGSPPAAGMAPPVAGPVTVAVTGIRGGSTKRHRADGRGGSRADSSSAVGAGDVAVRTDAAGRDPEVAVRGATERGGTQSADRPAPTAAVAASPAGASVVPPPSVAPSAPATREAPVASPAPGALEPGPRETAASLYRRAEVALRQGDDDTGRALLDQLVHTFPEQAVTDSARYELAVMAEKAGRSGEALAQTSEILRPGAQGPFVEPARFLRCRVHLAQDRTAAAACLTRFVRDFPASPHDEVALRALIDLSRQSGRCDDAKHFAATYLQRHPTGPFSGEANRARSQCGR